MQLELNEYIFIPLPYWSGLLSNKLKTNYISVAWQIGLLYIIVIDLFVLIRLSILEITMRIIEEGKGLYM